MSDEDAFQAALDANPADATARLVFADWLDEHGDAVRAAGYRALAQRGIYPYKLSVSGWGYLHDSQSWELFDVRTKWHYEKKARRLKLPSAEAAFPNHAVLPIALVGTNVNSEIGWYMAHERRELEERFAQGVGLRVLGLLRPFTA